MIQSDILGRKYEYKKYIWVFIEIFGIILIIFSILLFPEDPNFIFNRKKKLKIY